ncbi:MAG: ATP-binding protein [Candidatus Thiodiazotropha sp.]
MLSYTSTDYHRNRRWDDPWQSMLDRLLDNSPIEIYVFRADDYRLLKVNDRARRNLGYSDEDMMGLTLLELNRSMNEHQLDAMLHPLRMSERDQVAFETNFFRKDSSSYPVEVRVQFFPTESIPVFAAVIQDISERMKAEDIFREINEGLSQVTGADFFRELVRIISTVLGTRYALVGELIGEETGRVHTTSVWACGDYADNFEYDLNGTPCENVVGKELCCYPDRIQVRFPRDRLLSDMGVESYVGTPLFDRQHRPLGLLATLHNETITDTSFARSVMALFADRAAAELQRLQDENQLARQQVKLNRMSRISTLAEMATTMAHELNQPLYAIESYGQAVLEMLKRCDLNRAKAADALGHITSQARRASEIIRRIRGFIRRSPTRKQLTDLRDVVNHVCSILQSDPRNADIQCQVSADEGIPKVVVDPVEIQQVLFNLMQNSVEAMLQANSETRWINLKLQSTTPDKILITVEDSGPGLDKESRQRLFEPFHTSKPEGLGLGLAISRSIVEAYGGRLWVDANRQQGASFQFTLHHSS